MNPVQTGAIAPGALVGGVLTVVAGLWTLRIAVRSVGRLMSMVGTATRPVEAVEPGTVEVGGTVRSAGETVSGGITDDKAVVTIALVAIGVYCALTGAGVSVPIPF